MKYIVVILSVLISTFANANVLDKLQIYSENSKPYNYENASGKKGITVDIVSEMFLRSGSKRSIKDIHFIPWARAYAYLKNKPNILLFGTVKTQERADIFKWIGPIIPIKVGLVGEKGRQVKNLMEFNNHWIVSVRQDVGEQLLLNEGINQEKLYAVSNAQKALEMLIAGKVEYWVYDLSTAQYMMHKQNITGFEPVYTINSFDMYLALSRFTNDDVHNELVKRFDELKEEGFVHDTIKKYIPSYQ